MKKSELLELLKDIADDADINETLQGIEGLIKPLDINSIGLEDFKNVLENNKEAKAYYQSTLDSGIGKGVAAFKEKTLPGIIEEELKKANNKNKTPEQIALEELQAKFEALEKEKARAEMSSKYTKVLTEKGLNADLLDFILGADDETTEKNIETLSNIISSSVSTGIEKEITKDPPMPSKSQGIENLSGVEKEFYSRNPNLIENN
jgi:hypothetical protein